MKTQKKTKEEISNESEIKTGSFSHKSLIKKHHIFIVSAITIAILSLGGYFYYNYSAKQIRTEKENDLLAITKLKNNQIVQWRKERIADAKIITNSRFFANGIEEWLIDRNLNQLNDDILEQLQSAISNYGYEDIFLVSTKGEFYLSVLPNLKEIDDVTKTKILQVSNKNEISFTDFYYCTEHHTIHYDIIAPIKNNDNDIIAYLVFRINPYEFLYPLIQSWPLPSKSAELLLVSKDGDSVLFLNELRHQKNTALQLRIPLIKNDLPATQAILGKTGIFTGKDYRGIEVISCLAHVPNTDWFLVSKVDKSEIFSEIKTSASIVSIIILMLILTLITGIAWIYHFRQKNIYKNLWQTQEEYRTILYSIGDAVITTDTNGCITNMNKVAETLTGWEETKAIGKRLITVFNIINEVTRTSVEDPVNKVLKNGHIIGLANHTILISKNGTEFQIADSAAPIKNVTGEIKGVVFVFSDVTDKYAAQKHLKNAKEKAEKSDRLKSAFLANMSHEIRTPMNGILGFSDLLKEPGLTGETQQKYIRIIEKSGARMLNIINDIISISKIESGLMEVNLAASNVNEQIEYIHTFFKPEAEAKGNTLSFKNSLPLKEAIIKTDREKLFAILTNLVKNAIKYTDKGSIEFGYSINGEQFEFYVKDTGIGIDNDRQIAIFERFIQADIEDKMARQGAGLGLAISKAYVEILGGELWVESKKDIGSTFYFTIPYNAEKMEIYRNTENQETKNLTSPIKKLKILIVEDDETSNLFLNTILKEQKTEIICATTGTEAIKLCRENPDLDLILMDIKMPDMDGYEATKQIREFNKDVVIIAQTAHGLAGDREKAMVAGCNEHIPKPIEKKKLLSLIEQYFIN
jgi:PAS domain S-box-containing protein